MGAAPGAVETLVRMDGIRIATVSITWDLVAEWFARKRGADYWLGTRLSEDGHVEHFLPKDGPG